MNPSSPLHACLGIAGAFALPMSLVSAVVTGSILVGGSACIALDCKSTLASWHIETFEECATAGYPVIAGDPPRCIIGKSATYIREPDHLIIRSPKDKETIHSGATFQGEALAVGNTVHYSLRDASGKELAKGDLTTTSPDHGRWGAVAVQLVYDPPVTPTGTLSISDTSISGEEISVKKVTVTFGDAAVAGTTSPTPVAPAQTVPATPITPPTSIATMTKELFHSSKAAADSSDILFDPLATPATKSPPPAASLTIPFTSQAPLLNWSAPYDEACEEASALMVISYIQKKDLTPDSANNSILSSTKWELDNGYGLDLNAGEFATYVEQYYGYAAKAYTDDQVTQETIRRLISEGYPVIIPAAGRLLGNPNYTGNGPPYHMLVITGYDAEGFITNDPGTIRGKGYKYSYDTIMNAIHDWTGDKDTITKGKKALIVVSSEKK